MEVKLVVKVGETKLPLLHLPLLHMVKLPCHKVRQLITVQIGNFKLKFPQKIQTSQVNSVVVRYELVTQKVELFLQQFAVVNKSLFI